MNRRIDVVATVVSENTVRSPLSGEAAAFVHVEILEGDRSLGEVLLGDVVRLETNEPENPSTVDVVVRRATMRFASLRPPPSPMNDVPAELLPLLRGAKGGELRWREYLVTRGGKVRLRAFVDEEARRFVVRDDLGPVELDEIVF